MSLNVVRCMMEGICIVKEYKTVVCVPEHNNSVMHSIETHNFHIRRYGSCLYCRNGSKPVPKVMITEKVRY